MKEVVSGGTGQQAGGDGGEDRHRHPRRLVQHQHRRPHRRLGQDHVRRPPGEDPREVLHLAGQRAEQPLAEQRSQPQRQAPRSEVVAREHEVVDVVVVDALEGEAPEALAFDRRPGAAARVEGHVVAALAQRARDRDHREVVARERPHGQEEARHGFRRLPRARRSSSGSRRRRRAARTTPREDRSAARAAAAPAAPPRSAGVAGGP